MCLIANRLHAIHLSTYPCLTLQIETGHRQSVESHHSVSRQQTLDGAPPKWKRVIEPKSWYLALPDDDDIQYIYIYIIMLIYFYVFRYIHIYIYTLVINYVHTWLCINSFWSIRSAAVMWKIHGNRHARPSVQPGDWDQVTAAAGWVSTINDPTTHYKML